MVGCDILDLRCILVNEIFGSGLLAIITVIILWFIFSSKIRLGFRISIMVLITVLPIFGLMFVGFQPIYAFLTVIIAITIGRLIIQMMSGNK